MTPPARAVDAARRLVRERTVTSGHVAALWSCSRRTAHRYLYEEDLPGCREPVLPNPGNGGPHWWMRGEKHHNSKLTEDQVRAVWAVRLSGWHPEDVVQAFGLPVGESAVRRIWSGRNWRWLTDRLPPPVRGRGAGSTERGGRDGQVR